MSSITRLAFILGAAAAALAAPAIAELPSVADGAQESRIVPGKWIVSLKPDMAAEEREDHFGWVDMVHRRSLSCRQSVGVEKTFDIGNFHGYVGEFDEDLIAEIGAKAEVAAVEPDREAVLTALVEKTDQPWGLASISSKTQLESTDLDHQTYIYDDSAGEGTFAYMLDTGIDITHEDFEGRAIRGHTVWPEVPFEDDMGHGTHTAGTVGSARFGVAKKCTLVDVKTARSVYSTSAKIIEALEWVGQNVTGTPGKAAKSVASISLGEFLPVPGSDALDSAVEALTELGVLVVAGAGNDGLDDVYKSPARAASAIAVGAIAINNTKPEWSNYGPGIDVFAPGVDVRSTSLYQDGTELLSGTSMATPHVAGLALYLKALEGEALDSPAATKARIKELATKDAIPNPGAGSPNLIAYNGNGRR